MIKNLTKQDMKISHLSEARHNVNSEKEKQHSNNPRPAEDFTLLSSVTWQGNRIKDNKTDSSFLISPSIGHGLGPSLTGHIREQQPLWALTEEGISDIPYCALMCRCGNKYVFL